MSEENKKDEKENNYNDELNLDVNNEALNNKNNAPQIDPNKIEKLNEVNNGNFDLIKEEKSSSSSNEFEKKILNLDKGKFYIFIFKFTYRND